MSQKSNAIQACLPMATPKMIGQRGSAKLRNVGNTEENRDDIAATHARSTQRKSLPLSNVFDGSISTSDIMSQLEGHGGTSRMFARGKGKQEDLSSVGRFFSRGSTLERATAFTESAIAYERNASVAGRPSQRSRPTSIVEELEAHCEHPVQEMQFYNVGGAKVFFYYGLDTIRSPEHVMAAGPHVRDTAVGVLMLDQYKIQERPGDPSNPMTFWPYQTFYVIPQGVTFEKCKTLGSAGADALRDYPLETSAVCQALLALAEVASRNGYQRLMICGDCGYYSLAAEALAKSLSCWGSQSWVPHPDGAFASYRVPRFKSQSLDMDIILCLGTTQLISSPDPEKNLSIQLGNETSVVYLTADLRGWYSGEALKTVSTEYMPLLRRPWNKNEWHFNLDDELTMLDLVAQVNHSILTGVIVQGNDFALYKVADSLLELQAGSTAFMVGMYLGDAASKMEEFGSTPAERAFYGVSKLTIMAKEMALDDNGRMHPRDVIVEKVAPVFQYLRPVLRRMMRVAKGDHDGPLSEEEEFRSLAVLIGNPSLKGRKAPATYQEFKLELALRIQDTFMSLLTIAKLAPEISGLLPLGRSYVEFYANFTAKLNMEILPNVARHHAIDGRKFPLFDCRYVPGFGFQVAQGLTVWTACQNYFWMGTILLRFSEVLQNGWMGAAAYHLECTELFSFTPFFHEMGVPVVDGVNSLILASRSTDAPMRFVCFKQKTGGLPPTPSALVADVSSESVFGVSYYRDNNLALRTPTKDSALYKICNSLCRELMATDKVRWSKIRLARPLFEDYHLKWGFESYVQANPSDSIYPASSALDIMRYVEKGPLLLDYNIPAGSYVQYAPRRDGEMEEEDFRSFFGGNLFRDKKVGSKTIAYRITPSSSSWLGESEADTEQWDTTPEPTTELKRRMQRRMSW